MEANKENERRTKGISNIPVLIRSLPKSSRPLTRTEQQRTSKEISFRDPLKTITSQCVNQDLAGPSHELTGLKSKAQEATKKNPPSRSLKSIVTQRLIQKLDGSRQVYQPKIMQIPLQKLISQYDSVNTNNHNTTRTLTEPSMPISQIPKVNYNCKIKELCKKYDHPRNMLNIIDTQPNKDLAGPSHISKNYSSKNHDNTKIDERKHTLKDTNQFLKQNMSCFKNPVNESQNAKNCTNFNLGRNPLNFLTDQTLNQDVAGPSLENMTQKYNIYKDDDKMDKNAVHGHSKNVATVVDVNSALAGSSQNPAPQNIDTQTSKEENKGTLRTELLSAALMPSTSFYTPPLELFGSVKKVKKSLKRPHSRGLQSLPPLEIDFIKDAVPHNFSETDVNDSEFCKGAIIDELTQAYTADALKYLLSIEKKPLGSNISERDRSCLFNYILQVNGSKGNPAVAQSACWYLDSCVVNRTTTGDQLKLIAAACFWIASKFHGGAVHGMRMVRRAQFSFSVSDLALTEKNILRTLNFPTQPVVPQEFIPYLSWSCNASNSGLIAAAAAFLCQCGLTVCKTIGQEYASVVAAAAIKTALELLRMKAELKKLEECPVYHAARIKAVDMSATCNSLRKAVLTMVSVDYHYKTALFQFSVAPYYIAPKIMCAVHFDNEVTKY